MMTDFFLIRKNEGQNPNKSTQYKGTTALKWWKKEKKYVSQNSVINELTLQNWRWNKTF